MSRVELLGLQAERVLPIIVLLVAVFLRLHSLDTIPGGLLRDEAYHGIDALRILDGERPIFLTGNNGREALFVYLQAISVAFLGQTSLALRVVSAIIGILTVVAAYILVRRMFSARVALLTCGWVTVSLWHVIESRVGLRTISLPLFLAVGFYCLWRGLEGAKAKKDGSRSAIWFALGGIVVGLSLYTYSTARFAPFVIVALALYLAFLHRNLLRLTLPGLTLALALTTLVFLPEGLFFLRHPESFTERAQQVSILNPGIHQGNPGRALFDSALRSLSTFAIRGDYHWERNIPDRPIFDPLSALLMLLGLALAVRRFRQPACGFIVIWLLVMFIPTILGEDTPYHPRLTGLIPAIFVLPALGFAWLWEAWESRLSAREAGTPASVFRLPIVLVMLAFLVGTLHTYHSYFGVWANVISVTQAFGADRYATLQTAVNFARENKSVFVAVDDDAIPQIQFIFSRQPEAEYILTFDYTRSIIFPAEHAGASYLFTPDLPPASIMERYFDERAAQTIGTLPLGRPITLHRLFDPRPPFEPDLPLTARFGEQVFVYGFDLPKDVRAGETMTVRWFWRLLASEQPELVFTNQLFGVDGHHRGQYDARAFAPGYWPVGTSGITTFVIDIDPEAPTGAYWLRVAMYDRNKQDISNLPVFDAQGNQAGNHLILGPIKVHGQPPVPSSQGSVSDPRVPDNLLTARFDDQIDLQGYSLSVDRLLPGESLDLTLFWAPRGRPMRDYTVFVHILDDQGQLRRQADAPPRAGRYPTSVWDAGELIADLHTLLLAPDLPAGEYRLAIGLYDPETGQRVHTVDENGKLAGDRVIISGLVVEGE